MTRAETALRRVREDASVCRRCPLYANATQAVFGVGPVPSALMLVGEQPGDREDIEGRPFVGPAGKVLDKALAAAGLDREAIYVTNAVKHFKNEPRGKRRLHKRPSAGEIDICKWWLDAELALVNPTTVVALGASAARSLLGRPVGIEAMRDRPLMLPDERVLFVTIHPALLLRMPDRTARDQAFDHFVGDLSVAAARIRQSDSDSRGTLRNSVQPPRVLRV